MDIEDDNIVATIIQKSLRDNRQYFTQTKLTAYYNLVERTLRLYAVSSDKETVFKFIDKMSEKLKEDLKHMWTE